MIKGLYTAASGMVMEQTRNDTIANNLANVNTAGYKKDLAVFRTFPEMLLARLTDADKTQGTESEKPPKPVLIGGVGTGVRVDEIVQIHKLGPMRQTNAPLDLALGGEGFFAIATPQGERYTRNGSFSMDGDGYLVTTEGRNVLGQRGAIRVQGQEIVVDAQGGVKVDGQLVDTLKIVDFADKRSMTKEGDSLYAGTQPVTLTPNQLNVLQGFQEQSNVNAVTELVNMITAMRSYEANQKAIVAEDQLLDKAVNEVGRV